jgi:hypothetical protein
VPISELNYRGRKIVPSGGGKQQSQMPGHLAKVPIFTIDSEKCNAWDLVAYDGN